MNNTRMINLLIVAALLGSAGNVQALSRPTQPRTAVAKKAAVKKEAGTPGRLKRMRNWFGEEVFNRKKIGRNAKYVGGAAGTAALIALLYALMNSSRVARNEAGYGTDAVAHGADATVGRLMRVLSRREGFDPFGHKTRMLAVKREGIEYGERASAFDDDDDYSDYDGDPFAHANSFASRYDVRGQLRYA